MDQFPTNPPSYQVDAALVHLTGQGTGNLDQLVLANPLINSIASLADPTVPNSSGHNDVDLDQFSPLRRTIIHAETTADNEKTKLHGAEHRPLFYMEAFGFKEKFHSFSHLMKKVEEQLNKSTRRPSTFTDEQYRELVYVCLHWKSGNHRIMPNLLPVADSDLDSLPNSIKDKIGKFFRKRYRKYHGRIKDDDDDNSTGYFVSKTTAGQNILMANTKD